MDGGFTINKVLVNKNFVKHARRIHTFSGFCDSACPFAASGLCVCLFKHFVESYLNFAMDNLLDVYAAVYKDEIMRKLKIEIM